MSAPERLELTLDPTPEYPRTLKLELCPLKTRKGWKFWAEIPGGARYYDALVRIYVVDIHDVWFSATNTLWVGAAAFSISPDERSRVEQFLEQCRAVAATPRQDGEASTTEEAGDTDAPRSLPPTS